MSSRVLRSTTARRLRDAGCVAADAEATALLAASSDPARLESMVRRRERGEPLAWITGTTSFCGRPLRVLPGVFVPRAQTEVLAARASTRLPHGGRALDLCTGTGAVAAHLLAEDPTAAVIGVDVDRRAATCAAGNGVPTLVADVAEPLRDHRVFHVVTAVAPYVPTSQLRLLPSDVQRHEPRHALDGGADGLDVVRRVVAAAARLLLRGGRLLLEVGGDQEDVIPSVLGHASMELVSCWYDDDGDLRGVEGRADA